MRARSIRNFCIIAHIDHGKSTLADRFLEITHTLHLGEGEEQVLDAMDLEREKGITIKMHPVRMEYESDGQRYVLNLIDTPGHVDFTYEVSRSLAAVEGAILLVDATQGVEAQTLSNLYHALEQNLVIIPAINKIDLPNADVERVHQQILDLLGEEEIYLVSAKTGEGVRELLDAVVEKVPPPRGEENAPLQALIFDARFDEYVGVIPYIRVFQGTLHPGMTIQFASTGKKYEVTEVGVFRPGRLERRDALHPGEIGYFTAAIREIRDARVGDTVLDARKPADPIPGFREAKPMVYAGIYPLVPSDFPLLQKALEKLRLNDAALHFEGESSPALGLGFRVGFLGLLHMEIVKERLKREFGLDILVTSPNVTYRVKTRSGQVVEIHSPKDFPNDPKEAYEPFVLMQIITPAEYVGNVMELLHKRRGVQRTMNYMDPRTVLLEYELPLSEVIFDFFDKLKSLTRGYASMDYEPLDFRVSDLVRLDILLNGEPVEALAAVVHRDKAYYVGRELVSRLRKVVPRQLFEVKIQAAIGKKVIASERIPPLRKDVTAKCYGGDVTRKRKLLERQKEGKKRMKKIGRVELPQEAFTAILEVESE